MPKNIPLTNGMVAIVDDEDYQRLSVFKWGWNNGYARKWIGGFAHMHRMVCNFTITDHINGNKLDNRKCNLRESSRSTNGINRSLNKNNTSGCRGVHYSRRHRLYHASIGVLNKNVHIGWFKRFEDAVVARMEAEVKYFGEYAPIVSRPGDYHEA